LQQIARNAQLQAMKTLVLAGGLGSRLSEETVNRPNPIVKIGGKPLLFGICSAAGPNDFIVAAGYTCIATTLRSNWP
jgi:NDP-sugar pyrophosphorylase family protein